jgi:hypothetical protein
LQAGAPALQHIGTIAKYIMSPLLSGRNYLR